MAKGEGSSKGLVRNLGLVGAVAVSLAVVGPSMSVSLNPQAMAEQVDDRDRATDLFGHAWGFRLTDMLGPTTARETATAPTSPRFRTRPFFDPSPLTMAEDPNAAQRAMPARFEHRGSGSSKGGSGVYCVRGFSREI